jgi:predicted membrane protein
MKKIIRLLWWAFLGWIGIKLFNGFRYLSKFGKVLFLGTISSPQESKLLPRSSYALFFSALSFDFTKHEIISENCTIKIYGLFSAFDFVVPEDWKIELKGTANNSKVGTTNKCEI